MDGEMGKVRKLLSNGIHPSAADSAGYTALVSDFRSQSTIDFLVLLYMCYSCSYCMHKVQVL